MSSNEKLSFLDRLFIGLNQHVFQDQMGRVLKDVNDEWSKKYDELQDKHILQSADSNINQVATFSKLLGRVCIVIPRKERNIAIGVLRKDHKVYTPVGKNFSLERMQFSVQDFVSISEYIVTDDIVIPFTDANLRMICNMTAAQRIVDFAGVILDSDEVGDYHIPYDTMTELLRQRGFFMYQELSEACSPEFISASGAVQYEEQVSNGQSVYDIVCKNIAETGTANEPVVRKSTFEIKGEVPDTSGYMVTGKTVVYESTVLEDLAVRQQLVATQVSLNELCAKTFAGKGFAPAISQCERSVEVDTRDDSPSSGGDCSSD